MAQRKSVSPSKEKALAALLDSNTLTEAANKAGISRKTLYNYIRLDNGFAEAYKALRDEQTLAQAEDAARDKEQARAIIVSIMEDEQQPAAIRLKAAQSILKVVEDKETLAAAITKTNVIDTLNNMYAPLF